MYSNQIIFRDESGFLIKNVTPSELQYARSHNGYFFDCHGIRDYLNASTITYNVAIDVGANLGAVSYLLAAKSNMVISFEPHPGTFSELSRNIELNNLSNLTTEQLACSDRAGHSKMYLNKYHGHSSLNIRPDLKNEIEIRTIRLDEYLESKAIEKIDLLKIDVEGHELSVINGLGKYLNPDVCKVVIWEHSQFADKSSNNSERIFKTFVNAGYKLQDLKGNLINVEELLSQQHMDVLATA
jgi:FkbM family methyltransferase